MKHLCIAKASFSLLLVLLTVPSCSRNSSPPTPLGVDQLAPALERAFRLAEAEPRDLANQVIASVQVQDYSRAFLGLQSLTAMPHLTREQMSVTTRALLTMNGLLQSAQAQGDEKATAVLNYQHMTK